MYIGAPHTLLVYVTQGYKKWFKLVTLHGVGIEH